MRQRRELRRHSIYHVAARANRQELIFECDEYKEMFMEILLRAKEKFLFKLHNSTIMGNHIHLIIQPRDSVANISKIMQWILSVFALRFNKIHGYKGHVWYDRFKSRVVSTIDYFVNAMRYVADNPVRAGLVDHPLDWRYNGVCFWKNKRHRYHKLIDPPVRKMRNLINSYLSDYDKTLGAKIDKVLSFRDRPPGRPKKVLA